MHSDAFNTLADPTRRRIVEALLRGEQAVNDIVERCELHQSGVSRHLRILNEAGFVQMRPDGLKRLYSLRPEPFEELEAWVAQYRKLWRDDEDGQDRPLGDEAGVRPGDVNDDEDRPVSFDLLVWGPQHPRVASAGRSRGKAWPARWIGQPASEAVWSRASSREHSRGPMLNGHGRP